MNNIIKRLPVIFIGIPSVIYLVSMGGLPFSILFTIVLLLCAYEMLNLSKKNSARPNTFVVMTSIVSIAVLYYFLPNIKLIYFLVLIFSIVIMTIYIETFRGFSNPTINISTTFIAILYIGVLFGSMIALRQFDTFYGTGFTMCMLISVWICDSFAYSFGKAFGKKKLIERLSPKKTLFGFIAGNVGSFSSIYILNYLQVTKVELSLSSMVVFAIIIGCFGQWGDIAESMFKREVNTKDSSSLLFAHGGFLDRCDSLILTSPLVLIFAMTLLG
tara:strand:- start:16116 stop:16934 length:819 start_codon:yes stop_codon:yes gene_type:complete